MRVETVKFLREHPDTIIFVAAWVDAGWDRMYPYNTRMPKWLKEAWWYQTIPAGAIPQYPTVNTIKKLKEELENAKAR